MKITQDTIVQNLETFGKSCLELAEQIADSGRPLNQEEASLIRTAMFGWVKEILVEIEMYYLMGEDERLEMASDRLHQLKAAITQMS